jgi:glycosyltransferase involved in cell wall biosynthesis
MAGFFAVEPRLIVCLGTTLTYYMTRVQIDCLGAVLITPLISILLPVRNAERWLPSCLETLLDQATDEYEILVLNHGSTDTTQQVLDVYGQDNPIMRVFDMSTAPSLPALLNEGLQLCLGRYIARMDADDRSAIGRFAKQFRYLEANPRVGVVGSLVKMIPGDVHPVSEGYLEYAAWANALIEPKDRSYA